MSFLLIQSGSDVRNVLGLAMAVVAALSLWVGIWVLIRERARRISLSLLAASAAIAIYLLGFSFLVRATNPGAAERWAHVAYVGIPFIVPALFSFSIDMLGLWRRREGWIAAAWAVGLLYLILAQGTDLLIPGVMKVRWGYYTRLTAWNLPFLAWSLTLLALVLRDFWTAYSDADPVQKARIRGLAFPIVIASLGLLEYLPSIGIDLPPVGFAFLAAFPLAAAWVIGRYHLPDLTPAFAADQILATMAEPLIVVDPVGRVSITNPAAATLLGVPRDEMDGVPLASLVGAATAEDLLTGGDRRGQEVELRARDSDPVAVSVSTRGLVEKGRLVGTVIVARDITDERALEERLRESRQLEAIGRLAGGVAHDFNNILTTIQGTVALMQEEGALQAGLTAELAVIQKEAERAGHLTSQLLSFSRRQLTQPEVVDLNELLHEVRHGLEQILGPSRRLLLEPSDGTVRVRIDRGQLVQAMTELVRNADEAMGEEGRVRLGLESLDVRDDGPGAGHAPLPPGPYVRIAVADDGRGMDEATRARVFEPFFTTKTDGPSDGLGLASVYGIVRQAGGHIEVSSRDGAGTVFFIYLPRVSRAVAPEEPAGLQPDPGTSGRILVVEDEAPVRNLIRKVLERKGYDVLTAEDGERALEVAAEWSGEIDLLIADLVMPGMSGREVAERLAIMEPELATILMSGYTADDLVRAGIEQGHYTFIPKPFSPETLTTRVAEVLRARTAR